MSQILWIEEILHELVTIGYYETLQITGSWDKPSTNWCRISQPSTVCPRTVAEPLAVHLEPSDFGQPDDHHTWIEHTLNLMIPW